MKTIAQMLKQSYMETDETEVTLELKASVGFLRQNAQALAGMRVLSADEPEPARKGTAKKAKSTRGAKAKASQASAKEAKTKTGKTKPAKKTGTGSKRASSRINLTSVRDAIANNHQTPQAIADAIKADPRQVHKALSRYTKAGQVIRVDKGLYGLPA